MTTHIVAYAIFEVVETGEESFGFVWTDESVICGYSGRKFEKGEYKIVKLFQTDEQGTIRASETFKKLRLKKKEELMAKGVI